MLAALVATDADSKASAIEESRAAGERVQDALRHIRALDPPEVLRLVDQFERSWFDYQRVADQIFRLSRAGDDAAAAQVERAKTAS